MNETIIVFHIGELITVRGPNRLRKGSEMDQVETIKNGYVVVRDGFFCDIGGGEGFRAYEGRDVIMIDGTGLTVTPGLIDSHTHLVHAGSREHEFHQKIKGVSYLDILKQGGGILHTVKKTREASFEDLMKQARKSLKTMLCYGTTTIEAKSGYGLNMETEMKQLQVAQRLAQLYPVEIHHTFLGAHAIPTEYKNNKAGFLRELEIMLEEVWKSGLAEFCDVFCEEGVFSISEARDLLSKAKKLGYGLKIHADEIIPLGGAGLACELGCISADHLMASTEEDMKKMANSGVVANLLPLTSFSLNKDFAKARMMIEAGCGLAISTDYNPGSSPSENLQLAMQIASMKMRLTPKEVITAVTINAAYSIRQEHRIGSIEVGKEADFVLFDCPNLDYLIHHFGINHVKDVYKKGKNVVLNQKNVFEEEKI